MHISTAIIVSAFLVGDRDRVREKAGVGQVTLCYVSVGRIGVFVLRLMLLRYWLICSRRLLHYFYGFLVKKKNKYFVSRFFLVVE